MSYIIGYAHIIGCVRVTYALPVSNISDSLLDNVYLSEWGFPYKPLDNEKPW